MSARATTAPPLLAKRSTGPPIASMIRCTSSAWTSGVIGWAGSWAVLRSLPRGSYVTTVRSVKWPASVGKPLAPIGEPIRNSGGSVVESFGRTS